MMPLWTTATGPVLCGWAFTSEGRPCVAQRVCPTPTEPVRRLALDERLQPRQLSLAPHDAHPSPVRHRQARRVIPAVFELA